MPQTQSPVPNEAVRLREARTTPFLWISKTLISHYALSYRGLLAYMAIAHHVTGDMSCKMSMFDLATTVGLSETTMKIGIKELVDAKAIKVKHITRRKKGKGPQHLPNEYQLIDLVEPS